MNRIIAISLILFTSAMLFSSCVNPVNERTAQNYYDYGVQAERAGDLALARRNFSRAYGNAQMGNLGPAAEASYLYEYARLSGYTGSYEEAEKAFLDVLVLIEKASAGADRLRAPALAEYSRLLHDTGQHQKAVPIYERAVTELERVGVESNDPLGYAAFLDDYAESLNAAGFLERASAVAARSATLKTEHKNDIPRVQQKRYKG